MIRPQKGDIIAVLEGARGGRLLDLVNEQLSELVNAMYVTEGNGEFTLKLKFKNEGDGQVTMKHAMSVKKPIRSVGDSIFYANVDGGLEREDPKQPSMFADGKREN